MKHKFDLYIDGEFIFLSCLSDMDAQRIYDWRTSESGKFLNHPEGYSVESQKRWIQHIPEDEYYYMIVCKDHPITEVGMIGIMNCNWKDMTASVGALILDPKFAHHHFPYGIEALKLTYGYVFEKMAMRKIHGNIAGANEKVISLQKHLGMEQEGVLKRHALINSEYQDLILLSLFKEDFPKYSVNADKLLDKFRK